MEDVVRKMGQLHNRAVEVRRTGVVAGRVAVGHSVVGVGHNVVAEAAETAVDGKNR